LIFLKLFAFIYIKLLFYKMNILYEYLQFTIDSLYNLCHVIYNAYNTIYDDDFPQIDFLEEQ